MAEMFSSTADLSGLLQATEPLKVSEAVHKGFIEINEEGSEASAATGKKYRSKIFSPLKLMNEIFSDFSPRIYDNKTNWRCFGSRILCRSSIYLLHLGSQ